MAFIDAISVLNELKQRRVVRDYAVIGAVAATAYMEAMSTAGLDVIILADTDEEYIQTFGIISERLSDLLGRFDDEEKNLAARLQDLREQAFHEKEKWRRRQSRMSYKRKLEVLERLRQQRLLFKSAQFVD